MSEPRARDPVAESAYFHWGEFAVSASHPSLVRPVPDAYRPHVEQWVRTIGDPLRRLLGRPVRVLSGYRSAALNAAVGGSPTSQHRTASAVDIDPSRHVEVFRALLARPTKLPTGQVILYPSRGFLHVALPGERYPAPSFHVHEPSRGLVYHHVADVAAFDALGIAEAA